MFAGFPVEFTLVAADKVPLSVGFNVSFEIVGGESLGIYDQFTIGNGCGVSPDEFNESSEVLLGGTLSGVVCIPIPVEDLESVDTAVALNFGGDRQFFGVDGVVGVPAEVEADSDAGTTGPGSIGDPLPYGVSADVTWTTFGDADGSVWATVVGSPLDITQDVLAENQFNDCLLYTSPSPRDRQKSRMPSSA